MEKQKRTIGFDEMVSNQTMVLTVKYNADLLALASNTEIETGQKANQIAEITNKYLTIKAGIISKLPMVKRTIVEEQTFQIETETEILVATRTVENIKVGSGNKPISSGTGTKASGTDYHPVGSTIRLVSGDQMSPLYEVNSAGVLDIQAGETIKASEAVRRFIVNQLGKNDAKNGFAGLSHPMWVRVEQTQ